VPQENFFSFSDPRSADFSKSALNSPVPHLNPLSSMKVTF